MKVVFIGIFLSSSLFSCENSFTQLVEKACKLCTQIQLYNHFLIHETPDFKTVINVMDKKNFAWNALTVLLDHIEHHTEYKRERVTQLVIELCTLLPHSNDQYTIINDRVCS